MNIQEDDLQHLQVSEGEETGGRERDKVLLQLFTEYGRLALQEGDSKPFQVSFENVIVLYFLYFTMFFSLFSSSFVIGLSPMRPSSDFKEDRDSLRNDFR